MKIRLQCRSISYKPFETLLKFPTFIINQGLYESYTNCFGNGYSRIGVIDTFTWKSH